MNIFFSFRKLLPIIGFALTLSCYSIAQQNTSPTNQSQKAKLSEQIRLNQIGFYPSGPKMAVVIAESGNTFHVTTIDLRKTVFTGKLSEPRTSEFSDKKTRIADFSAFTTPGSYVVHIPELGHSYPFEIKPKVHQEVAKASIKGFYFQRISTPLPEQYAGKWQRPAGHVQEDTQVLIHPSAATTQRPEGTKISAPLGWYDAGDYNKYI